jgi:8-oxo-dGTP pyrophosphatase MutT (NUDIX family)
MVQRKHSMAFTEFVRGKYNPEDTEFIKRLICNMTFAEHTVLKSMDFSNIWTNHWGIGRDHHSHEYDNSKSKYDSLDILSLIGKEGYSESEWGFPKGRRQHREPDLNCAIREFTEETDIPRDSYTVCKNLILEETFKGTNNIDYRHLYFICVMKDPIILNSVMTSEQEREICQVKWMTLDECFQTTRPHLVQREKLLTDMRKIIQIFTT